MEFPEHLLYPYQQRWLDDKSRFKAGMFSRQSGKTFTCTLEIAKDCVEAEATRRPTRWVILSRGERQAKEAMEAGLNLHLRALRTAFEMRHFEQLMDDGKTRVSGVEVTLPGGSRVTALPANPDTARGFSSNVLLDEFAFHINSRKIWGAVFPVMSSGNKKLRVISTPNGKGNKFHELMTDRDPQSPWSRHVVNIRQAVAEGLPRDVDELKRGLNDPDAWAQEFELEWLDEALAWLPYDLLASIEHHQAGDPEKHSGGATYIGNDIAARKDLWVAWVWERVGDVLWSREVRTLRRASFAEQAAHLDELVERYRPVRIAMDQTGMGEAPTEEAKRRYGEYRVEGVLFTAPAKQHLAALLKQRAEDRRLRIPADAAIRADLHSLRRVTTPAGNVRFDVHGSGESHADRAWAAALGIHAADTPVEVFDYRPVRKQGYGMTTRERRLGHCDDRGARPARVTGGFARGVI
ncbi:MAG: terminase family protein [Bryobacterales bacterium]|nr:terminase family protein [Bryobacterales bacterium]